MTTIPGTDIEESEGFKLKREQAEAELADPTSETAKSEAELDREFAAGEVTVTPVPPKSAAPSQQEKQRADNPAASRLAEEKRRAGGLIVSRSGGSSEQAKQRARAQTTIRNLKPSAAELAEAQRIVRAPSGASNLADALRGVRGREKALAVIIKRDKATGDELREARRLARVGEAASPAAALQVIINARKFKTTSETRRVGRTKTGDTFNVPASATVSRTKFSGIGTDAKPTDVARDIILRARRARVEPKPFDIEETSTGPIRRFNPSPIDPGIGFLGNVAVQSLNVKIRQDNLRKAAKAPSTSILSFNDIVGVQAKPAQAVEKEERITNRAAEIIDDFTRPVKTLASEFRLQAQVDPRGEARQTSNTVAFVLAGAGGAGDVAATIARAPTVAAFAAASIIADPFGVASGGATKVKAFAVASFTALVIDPVSPFEAGRQIFTGITESPGFDPVLTPGEFVGQAATIANVFKVTTDVIAGSSRTVQRVKLGSKLGQPATVQVTKISPAQLTRGENFLNIQGTARVGKETFRFRGISGKVKVTDALSGVQRRTLTVAAKGSKGTDVVLKVEQLGKTVKGKTEILSTGVVKTISGGKTVAGKGEAFRQSQIFKSTVTKKQGLIITKAEGNVFRLPGTPLRQVREPLNIDRQLLNFGEAVGGTKSRFVTQKIKIPRGKTFGKGRPVVRESAIFLDEAGPHRPTTIVGFSQTVVGKTGRGAAPKGLPRTITFTTGGGVAPTPIMQTNLPHVFAQKPGVVTFNPLKQFAPTKLLASKRGQLGFGTVLKPQAPLLSGGSSRAADAFKGSVPSDIKIGLEAATVKSTPLIKAGVLTTAILGVGQIGISKPKTATPFRFNIREQSLLRTSLLTDTFAGFGLKGITSSGTSLLQQQAPQQAQRRAAVTIQPQRRGSPSPRPIPGFGFPPVQRIVRPIPFLPLPDTLFASRGVPPAMKIGPRKFLTTPDFISLAQFTIGNLPKGTITGLEQRRIPREVFGKGLIL